MNNLQKDITSLLKSAITGEKYNLTDDFKLEDTKHLAKIHSIIPLIYQGALNCGFSQADPTMQEYFLFYCKNLMCSEKQMDAVQKIYDVFEENSIDYMPVKGCNMKCLYPSPELRVMGDADILIKEGQYPKIEKIMKNLGFTFHGKGDHDYAWDSPTLNVELHYLLMYAYNSEYEQYYGNGWRLSNTIEGHKHIMSYEDEFIYLFIHFTKHYRIGGIGIRHVLDLWVYLHTHPGLDFTYIENVVEKLSVLEFYKNTKRLTEVWFENKISDDITELMTEFVFNSGSWGTNEQVALAKGVKQLQLKGSKSRAKFKVLKDLIFPPFDVLKTRYNILYKYPALAPIIWIWRWFDTLLFKRQNIKRRTAQVKTVYENDLSAYENSLSCVGLNFIFNKH